MNKEQNSDNPQNQQLNITGIMWRCLSDEYPEPYRNIKIELENEIIETRTYLHQHKLMIELRDGNEWFEGVSPKLFEQSTRWCYKAT